MPYVFPPGQNAESLVDRLGQCGWRAEIVGPHGSGKSALLAALTAAIERAGPRTVLVALHDGQRRLPLDLVGDSRLQRPVGFSEGDSSILADQGPTSLDGATLVPAKTGTVPPALLIVDGYEQLSRWSRMVLKRSCRRRSLGLLVTSHEPVGLPELCRTAPTLALAQQIVGQLMRDWESAWGLDELADCFSRHGGDLREMLFDLYDLYQQRHPAKM
jgi:hypothetical protein